MIEGYNLKYQIELSSLGVAIDCLSEEMRDGKAANADDPLDEIIQKLINPSERYLISAAEELELGGVGYIKFNNELRNSITNYGKR